MDNKARSMLSSYLRDIKMRCKSEQLMFRNLAGYESKRLRLTRTHNSKITILSLFRDKIHTNTWDQRETAKSAKSKGSLFRTFY